MTGTLWLVATPIGTLDDLSPRAEQVISSVDILLAEDTRRLMKLVRAKGISLAGKVISFHEHNEQARLRLVMEVLREGRSVALTSDAGTPVISDPGFKLVREARAEGIPVMSVPGPSAVTAAVAASGQPPIPFVFLGFLPRKRGRAKTLLERWRGVEASLVIFLSPHRLSSELSLLAEVLGPDREATLLAELSKAHERALAGTLSQLASSKEAESPRGEYVVVVGPAPKQGQKQDKEASS